MSPDRRDMRKHDWSREASDFHKNLIRTSIYFASRSQTRGSWARQDAVKPRELFKALSDTGHIGEIVFRKLPMVAHIKVQPYTCYVIRPAETICSSLSPLKKNWKQHSLSPSNDNTRANTSAS